jgi:hypothetical protein
VDAFRSEFFNDEWVWDQEGKSPEALLANNNQAVYFNIDPVDGSTGTSGRYLIVHLSLALYVYMLYISSYFAMSYMYFMLTLLWCVQPV